MDSKEPRSARLGALWEIPSIHRIHASRDAPYLSNQLPLHALLDSSTSILPYIFPIRMNIQHISFNYCNLSNIDILLISCDHYLLVLWSPHTKITIIKSFKQIINELHHIQFNQPSKQSKDKYLLRVEHHCWLLFSSKPCFNNTRTLY